MVVIDDRRRAFIRLATRLSFFLFARFWRFIKCNRENPIIFQLYLADTTGGAIRRLTYDGKDVEVFLDANVNFVEGVAVDWQARNIFWTDSGKRTIEVANLDSKSRRILLDEKIKNPRGIVAHPALRWLLSLIWSYDYITFSIFGQ